MANLARVSDSEIRKATVAAKKLLENSSNPRLKELVTNGLLFSQGSAASTQTIVQVMAPILAELGVDFVLEHMHDTRDDSARDLAHKFLRDMVGHGVRVGIVDTVIKATTEENEKSISQFAKLCETLSLASKEGMSFEDALNRISGSAREIRAEEVTNEGE